MSQEWKFRRRDGRCGTCQAAFPDDSRHASILAILSDEVRREDLCVGCWERHDKRGDVFYWFTRHKAARGGLVLDLVTLEQLFLHLEGRLERPVRELRYLVALLLMRKRRLKLVRVTRGAETRAGEVAEAMILRRPRRKETFEVFVFDFTAERMDELRQKLVGLFDGHADLGAPGEVGSGGTCEPSAPAPVPDLTSSAS